MSLSQSARSQHHTRQQNRLLLCLGAAIAVHGFLLVGWSLEQRENRQRQKDPIGVEFVYLDPVDRDAPNPEAPRQAQVSSVAGGTQNSNLPTSAGKPVVPSAPSRSTSPRSSVNSAQPAVSAASRPSSSPQPQTAQQGTDRPSAAPQTAQPVQPQAATPPRPEAPAGSAASPVNPQSGQGLDGQINPDRTAAGAASIDAAANEAWGVYVSTLNRKIDQNWQRITVSATRQARVQFELDRQGRLIDLKLVESSGDSAADAVALQAVQLAAPFASFPSQTAESRLTVNFTFTYRSAGVAP